jgi:hypothetical protein
LSARRGANRGGEHLARLAVMGHRTITAMAHPARAAVTVEQRVLGESRLSPPGRGLGPGVKIQQQPEAREIDRGGG